MSQALSGHVTICAVTARKAGIATSVIGKQDEADRSHMPHVHRHLRVLLTIAASRYNARLSLTKRPNSQAQL